MGINSKVLEEYKIKVEESSGIKMVFAYNNDDKYIGTLEFLEMLIKEHGLSQIQSYGENDICSIAFCEKEQKWYGWSHRAIGAF